MGTDLRDIYVTTIGGDDREEHGPGADALFRLRPGIKGAQIPLVRRAMRQSGDVYPDGVPPVSSPPSTVMHWPLT